MVIFVHMASVWVPFTSESKEAIADYDEIRKEIKLALQECGRRLGVFLRRRERAKSEFRRRNIFELYIEEVVEACARLKGGKLPKDKLKAQLQKIAAQAHRRRPDRRDPGPATSGPEGLPHSIIVTPKGPRARRPSCRRRRDRGRAAGRGRPETEAPTARQGRARPAAARSRRPSAKPAGQAQEARRRSDQSARPRRARPRAKRPRRAKRKKR